MQLEVLSNNGNAVNQILAGLKRRNAKLDDHLIDNCNEVAYELGYVFEYKEETLIFTDKKKILERS